MANPFGKILERRLKKPSYVNDFQHNAIVSSMKPSDILSALSGIKLSVVVNNKTKCSRGCPNLFRLRGNWMCSATKSRMLGPIVDGQDPFRSAYCRKTNV